MKMFVVRDGIRTWQRPFGPSPFSLLFSLLQFFYCLIVFLLMGAVTLALLVAGVRKLDREEEGRRRSGSKNKGSPAA
jgi:hypothetical protein